MDLKQRKVAQFRTHYDPMIGGKPQQAFNMKLMDAYAEVTPIGVYVKLWVGGPGSRTQQEHVVPYANVQSIMLEPEAKEEKTDSKAKSGH